MIWPDVELQLSAIFPYMSMMGPMTMTGNELGLLAPLRSSLPCVC